MKYLSLIILCFFFFSNIHTDFNIKGNYINKNIYKIKGKFRIVFSHNF